jgi:hypothetical protein
METKAKGRPYVITFCGVNGVCAEGLFFLGCRYAVQCTRRRQDWFGKIHRGYIMMGVYVLLKRAYSPPIPGVGKSTNLAKLAYWLLQNDFSILIAACDTFRAGAVEQVCPPGIICRRLGRNSN